MTYLRTYVLLILFIAVSSCGASSQELKLRGAFFSSAIGDALGRVTEFIDSVEKQFERYPGGLTSFKDFKEGDYVGVPYHFRAQKSAPYTDDTRLALLVADTLVQARHKGWDKETTMSNLAYACIKDYNDKSYGWAAGYRVPGRACIAGVKKLMEQAHHAVPGWWDVHAFQAGGCGSVMRAFPFGCIFADDPEKAKTWSADHSKLTHGAPCAVAACAAMALGTAECLSGAKDSDDIIQDMIKAAEEFDSETAEKMRKAYRYAHETKTLLAPYTGPVQKALLAKSAFFVFHKKVFNEFLGWAAHDALAATVYVFALSPTDSTAALFVSVHTQEDSDSIAAMAGALVGAYSGLLPDPYLMNSIEDAQRIESLVQEITRGSQYSRGR